MRRGKVLALILGGGKGTRLYPLTKERCKPAISFGGKYRFIDIPISNCLNSGVNQIFILTQFLTTSIHRHIFQTYHLDMLSRGFIEVLPAEQTLTGESWYQGTADAVRRTVRYIQNLNVDEVLILSGDQICKMNYGPVLDFHKKKNAGLTIIGHPIAIEDVPRMGILKLNQSDRIMKMVEKPKHVSLVKDCKSRSGCFMGSTGNYVFNRDVLLKVLTENKDEDFGKQIIPYVIRKHPVFMYPFNGYWEDIGTIKSFFYANLDLASPLPKFDLYDEEHPIFTHARSLPAAKVQNSIVKNSLISEGSIIEDALIENAVIGIRSFIRAGATIRRSILMGNDYYHTMVRDKKVSPQIGRNVVIEGAIIDKNVIIGDNVKILGLRGTGDSDHPIYCVRDGIVVITKGTKIPAGTVIKG